MSISPLVAAAAFAVGVLVALGIARLGKAGGQAEGRSGSAHIPASGAASSGRFRLIDVDGGPHDLASQTPATGILLRELPGPDRPDYWLARLDVPLRWTDEDTDYAIDHLVLAARLEGESIGAGFDRIAVGIAYVVDPTLPSDAALTFAKVRYVAIGSIERA
jgi:hypothetical protein